MAYIAHILLFKHPWLFWALYKRRNVRKVFNSRLRCVMAKILFIGAKDISAVRQPNHQDCPLGCDFRLEIKMLRSRLLHRIFSFISDVLSTKISCIFTYFFAISQNLCKEDFEFLRKIAVHAILETMIMGTEWNKLVF